MVRFLLVIIAIIFGLLLTFLFIFTKIFRDAEFMQNLRDPLEYIQALLLLYLCPMGTAGARVESKRIDPEFDRLPPPLHVSPEMNAFLRRHQGIHCSILGRTNPKPSMTMHRILKTWGWAILLSLSLCLWLVARLDSLRHEDGDECFADITYSHTSIGSAGDQFVAKFTADYYQRFMQAWEKALNHFLRTGCRLPDDCAA